MQSTQKYDVALGAALLQFDANLKRLRDALSGDALLSRAVFDGAEEWSNLLSYKLVPHLAGDGCLIVAVAGGTNTGKSTVFNLLLGRNASPMVATAAATARPVIAANARRARECLDGKLVPEFLPTALEDVRAVVERTSPPNTLFVTTHDALPDRIVLLDTPDVDSIEREHWAVADAIRAAGDVIVAVLTGEKYKDDRVVGFFRHALASGRIVAPLMNKANPERDFEVARKQLG
ncbi:MAG: dynamin family protein, partial [Candidatus Hydrogenedentes bacterium]|nr:dynamin family protein [Candidatus Hydrogenedentota bacterium]